jgi:hypothetical protein
VARWTGADSDQQTEWTVQAIRWLLLTLGSVAQDDSFHIGVYIGGPPVILPAPAPVVVVPPPVVVVPPPVVYYPVPVVRYPQRYAHQAVAGPVYSYGHAHKEWKKGKHWKKGKDWKDDD